MKTSYGGRGRQRLLRWIVAVAMAAPVAAQTRIDLKTQGKALDYDFSQILGTASITQGGTGATTAAAARANLGAAAVAHTHLLTDLAGISGKQGSAPTLLSFGGGAPVAGECAQFDGAGNVVGAGAACGAGASPPPNFAVTFSAETTKTASAAEHGFYTADLLGSCYDTTVSPWRAVDGYSMTVNPVSYDVVFTFPVSFTGKCIINAGGGGGGGDTVAAGDGIVVSGSSPKTIAIDSSTVPFYLQGTFSADFSTIANGACGQKTFSLPGAKTGMTGLVAVSTAFAAGINTQLAKVNSTGVVAVEICNLSGGSYTPAAGLTYTVTLIGGL